MGISAMLAPRKAGQHYFGKQDKACMASFVGQPQCCRAKLEAQQYSQTSVSCPRWCGCSFVDDHVWLIIEHLKSSIMLLGFEHG